MSVPYNNRFSSRAYLNRISSNKAERSPFVTGADMVIKDGDLVLTAAGDISVATGAECIINGLLRRLGTPPFGYRRYVRTTEGLKEVDASYKDGIYNYLSAPLTQSNAVDMVSALRQAAQADGRVQIISVTHEPVQAVQNSVRLRIQYRIRSEQALSDLSLTVPLS